MMNEKVDVVIPMVFNGDRKWQSDFFKYTSQQPDSTRWRDWGYGECQLDLIFWYMSWVNKVYIILSGETQRRPWMDRPYVKVVYHDDFIPSDYLPTFNCWTFEMFLHRIPGLSEHFIYFNDDMFPLRRMEKKMFFDWRGEEYLPVFHPKFNNPTPPATFFQKVCQNGMNLAAKAYNLDKIFDRWTYLWYGHGPNPMLRSEIEKFFEAHENEICKSLTVVRDEKNLPQYLWLHILTMRGKYIDRQAYVLDYVENLPSLKTMRWYLGHLLDYSGHILCFNDNVEASYTVEYRKAIHNFLVSKLSLDLD